MRFLITLPATFLASLAMPSAVLEATASFESEARRDASRTASAFSTSGSEGLRGLPAAILLLLSARAYARWLSEEQDLDWRLPYEMEWEKAARGPDGLRFPWGNEPMPSCEIAIVDQDDEPDNGTEGCGTGFSWPVGSRPQGASPYGIQDMIGNVWEWTYDDWSVNHTLNLQEDPVVDRGAQNGEKVKKGGKGG